MDFLLQCISLFYKGGPVMYVIAGCSLAVVAIAVERFIYFRQMSTDAQVFINKLQPLLERKKIAEAQQLCEHTPAVIGRLAAEGLEAYQKESNLEVIMEGTAALSAARLREYLNYLSSIVTLSPLLGLLGTVIGMINSFSVFNVKNGQPMAITGGIGEALVATATGLMVAIMALVVHIYFTHRLDQLVTDMEQVYTLIMTRLAGNKKLGGKIMKLRSLRIEKQPELMIIPMIDIIFFLLIFFMMSTLYMVEQHTIPINLPQAAAVQKELSENINITILQNGNIMFDQEEIPFSLLQKRISIELAKHSENIFVVRADKQAEYGQVVAVLDELKMSGARRVAVATDRKGR